MLFDTDNTQYHSLVQDRFYNPKPGILLRMMLNATPVPKHFSDSST